jgi:PAS domain S-box-containing protein
MDLGSLLDKIGARVSKLFRSGWRNLLDWIRKPSLRKTAVVTMLAISILPILIVGTVATLRTRTQVRALTTRQINTLVETNAQQLVTFSNARAQAIDGLAANPLFIESIQTLLTRDEKIIQESNARIVAGQLMRDIAQPAVGTEIIFNYLFVIQQNRTVLVASDNTWADNTFGSKTKPIDTPTLVERLNQNATFTLYGGLPPTYSSQMVMVTMRGLSADTYTEPITLVGVTASTVIPKVLTDLSSYTPGSLAYFQTADGKFVGSQSTTAVQALPENAAVARVNKSLNQKEKPNDNFSLVSYDNQRVLGSTRYIPEIDTYLVLEVPQSFILSQSKLIDPVTGTVLGIMLLLAGTMIYIGASQIVNPIVQLTQVAHYLADGELSTRAQIRRKDEIGLLGISMNQMADELGHLYQTMEQQVEERTSQLRTASEVAQMAISTTHLGETLTRTVELVNERFGFYHTSIYLVEQNGIYVTLREASGEIGAKRLEHGERIPVGDPSPVGWVARNNESRVIIDVQEDPSYRHDEQLPDARCEAAIPITAGSLVLGVLDIRSSRLEPITPDEIFVLQTLSNQVAGAIQNIRLLETAQVDLEETALLYEITRRVAQTRDDSEIQKILLDSLPKIPHTNAFLALEGSNLHILSLYDRNTNKVEQGLSTITIPVQRMIDRLNLGEMIFIDNVAQPSDFDNLLSFFLRRNCKSAAIFPSLQAGRCSRVIILGFRQEDRVGREVLQPFSNLAAVISTTLDRFSVLHTLQERLAELQILANFSQATSAETQLDRLYHVLHQQVMQTLGDDLSFAVLLYNQEKNLIEVPYAYENRELMGYESFPLGEGLTSYVIQNRQALLLTENFDQRARELGARIIGQPAKSWMGIPLVVAGELVGALVVQDLEQEKRFTQNDLNLFTTLGTQIATSIRNAQLIDEMRESLSVYDQDRLILNTWLQNTPDSIAIKDAEGQYLRVSQSLAARVNLTPEELVGKTDFAVFEEAEAARIAEMDQTALHSGRALLNSVDHVHQDEHEYWFMSSRIPIFASNGSSFGLMNLRRDITEIKLAEAAARQRAEEVLIAAEIARDSSSILDVDELLHKAVELVRERFGFYHVSVFLIDTIGQNAVLRESTGDAGRQMKATGHKLAVGSRSIVGQTTQQGQAVIVRDVHDDPTHFPNPLLPETRAEMAIPMKIGERVLGALDVQSTKPGVFTPTDVSILSILADQLAVAVNNADLFTRTQDMLTKHRLLHQITATVTSSDSLTDALGQVALGLHVARIADRIAILLVSSEQELTTYAMSGFEATSAQTRYALGQGLVGASALSRSPIRIADVRNDPRYIREQADTLSEMVLPIVFGDEFMGVLNLESDQLAYFSENDQEIMSALANNLGAIISNYRLVTQIRRQVERQQILFNATSRIRRSVDMQSILKTSVDEIGRALGVSKANISLALENETLPNPVDVKTGGPKNGSGGKVN